MISRNYKGSYIYIKLIITVFASITSIVVQGQPQTTKFKKVRKPTEFYDRRYNIPYDSAYFLSGHFKYDSQIDRYMRKILFPISKNTSNRSIRQINAQFIISESSFYNIHPAIASYITYPIYYTYQTFGGSISYNEFNEALTLRGISGGWYIVCNQTPRLNVSESQSGDVHIYNNRLKDEINIRSICSDMVIIDSNSFSYPKPYMSINNSSVKDLFIGKTKSPSNVFNLSFSDDTLGNVNIGGSSSPNDKLANLTSQEFYHCIFNGSFNVQLKAKQTGSTIYFNKCLFNSKASIDNIEADTLIFNTCTVAEGFSISFTPLYKPVTLKFLNTDFSKIDFEYDGRYKLYQWSNRYLTQSIYEKLLLKFSTEKKLDSYKYLDIEYFKYRHNVIVNTINYFWWNYGYNKWLIILWTIGFLLIFSIINSNNWVTLYRIYPIVSELDFIDINDKSNLKSKINSFLRIFVYTSFIFFSLRIDFNILSFKNTKYLMYFFFQYLTGLICLFFIANSILKL